MPVPVVRFSAAALLTGAVALGVLAGCADTRGSATRQAEPPPPAPASTSPSASPTFNPDAPTGWGPTEGELAAAADLVAAMSRADRVSTVLMPGFWGYDAAAPDSAEAGQNQVMHGVATAADALDRHAYGGVFLRPEVVSDATQVGELVGDLRAVGDRPDGLPLLVSIDQEGGVVQRLQVGVDPVPSAATVGATGDPGYAKQVARENGGTLRDLGITMVMAPVADVDPHDVSVLGSRMYSSEPEAAARMVTATVRGYLEAGVLPVVKHFPGLGTVAGDSHVMLPVQHKPFTELAETELVPFEAAVRAGAPLVMTAHVAVDAIEPGIPASTSRDLVSGVLRGSLGFEGVAVTDSHGMEPIHARWGSGGGAVRALLAGNDLVLNSPDPSAARAAVEDALATGRLSARRLDEAASRVLALRMYLQRLTS